MFNPMWLIIMATSTSRKYSAVNPALVAQLTKPPKTAGKMLGVQSGSERLATTLSP